MVDDRQPPRGALTGFVVLDLADELGAYASRLLGDLGADVIRIEPPGGSRTRRTGPFVPGPDGQPASAFERFVNAGKRSIVLDLETAAGRSVLERLVPTADVVFETFRPAMANRYGITPEVLLALNPRLVHVSITPFGRDRTSDAVDDDDLTIMAAGGLLALGGYRDTEPIVAAGGQSRNAASIFAAVASLVALLDRERTGIGRWIDVSAQECVAQGVEDSVAAYEMTGRIRRRHGLEAAEAGSGVYPCADGLVAMVAGRVGTAKAWRALVAWLVEVGAEGATELQEPAWSELPYRQTKDAIRRFSEIFEDFACQRTRLELYREAQSRGIALSPVNDMTSLLRDPQLGARGFWVGVPDRELGTEATFPGPPYRLSETPALAARPAPALNADLAPDLDADLAPDLVDALTGDGGDGGDGGEERGDGRERREGKRSRPEAATEGSRG